MKIVTTTDWLEQNFGIEKTIEMIAEAEFDGLDYCDININVDLSKDEYIRKAKLIRQKAESCGIKIYQTHAPITTALLKKGDMNFCQSQIIRSLEFAGILGAEAAVVHPFQHPSYSVDSEYVYQKNMELFASIIPYCKETGVKIAIENMVMADVKAAFKRDGVCANPVEFKRYIDSINSDYVTGCLDLGHCAISGRLPQDMLRVMGSKYITCLHIHDNDYIHDCHALPCTMSLDWDEICRAIADIGYSGHFTLEAICFLPKYGLDFIPVALKFMYDTSDYLIKKIKTYMKGDEY